MALKESYEDQNPGGQFLKKYQPHENVLEYLSYGQHKSFCLSRRHHARVRTRRGQRFTLRLFYTAHRNNAVKEGKIDVEVGEDTRRTKKVLFIMILYKPSPRSQYLVL